MRIGGDLQLPGNANRAGVVVVNIDAGVIECGELVHGSILDEGPSYTDDWLLDIEQGMFIIHGDVKSAIDANVAAGQITAYDGEGFVIVELIDGNTVVTGIPDPNSASNPDPPNKSRNVPLDQVLSWTPGDHATLHDLFIGTSFDDVNDATTSDSTYQDRLGANSWDPCSNGFNLEKAVTYYWRIDEIDDSVPIHAHSPWKGRIWRFMAQGDIVDPNMLIWYKFDEPNGFDAMDSSGYGNHGMFNGFENLWDTNDGHDGGCRIFDGETVVQVSSSVLSNIDRGISFSVWLKDNYSNSGNVVFGTGVGGETGPFRVQAEVLSDNDVEWRAGNDSNDLLLWNLSSRQGWHHFAFVKDEIKDEMCIYFNGELAASKTGVNDTLTNIRNAPFKVGAPTWSNYEYEGKMDDFKVWDRALTAQQVAGDFRGGDLGVAWAPDPGDNVVDVPRDKILEWRPGDFAEFHDVYLGTNWDDVNDANTNTLTIYRGRQNIGDTNYPQIENLTLNTPYYWRIDEVNNANGDSPWKGNIWKFTVANFIIIDDFESYTKVPESIWWSWENPLETGSWIGLGTVPFQPVHTGAQSMEYGYDNTDQWGYGYYSETVYTYDSPQDWTDSDVKVLTLYFYGDPDNDANASEQMYVGLEDNATDRVDINYSTMSDIKQSEWQEWNILLSDFTNVDQDAIKKIYIGFGDSGAVAPGGEGVVYIDSIRLYPSRCIPEFGPAFDFSGDCIVGFAEIAMMGQVWLKSDRYVATSAPPGPLVHYEFEEGTGSIAIDSANGYNAVFMLNDGNSTEAFWEAGGRFGGAVRFEKIYALQIPPLAFSSISNQITVSVWVNWDNATTMPDETNQLFSIHGGPGQAYGPIGGVETAWVEGSLRFWDSSNDTATVVSADDWSGGWNHYAFVKDVAAEKLQIYLNSDLISESDSNAPIVLPVDNAWIGMATDDVNTWHDEYSGQIDDFQVFDSALSVEQVGHLASNGTGYIPVIAIMNIYDEEPEGSKSVNFRDYALLLESWLEKQYWP
jgi:hypothetical protein